MRRWIIGIAGLVMMVTGCTFSAGGGEKTPIRVTPTAPPTAILTPTPTPVVVDTDIPTPVPTATLPPTLAPPTMTLPPSLTPVQAPPTGSFATQAPPPQLALSPTLPPTTTGAQVCESCGNLRLRTTPGTAGEIVDHLAAGTPLTIIGRTEDNAWVQVALPNGRSGWVASRYVEIAIDLNTVSVNGEAVDSAFPTAVAVVAPGEGVVVSGISSTARQIYLEGQARGNLPNAFSKVGDSITIMPFFFHQFSDTYSLGDYGYLAPALSFFSGPNARGGNCFSTNSLASGGGWSTDTVLTPGGGDGSVCGPSETPLACEYRVSRPSVALIMLGTNDSGGIPTDRYRANLDRIVRITIDHGIIPVLSTIPPTNDHPDRNARIGDYNQIVLSIARAYDIPVWHYWQAMVNLPGQGLGPDGIHPSVPEDGLNAHLDAQHLQYGFPVRNLTGLQVLYELWRQVLYDATPGQAAPPAPPPPAEPVATSDPTNYVCPGTLPVRLTVGGQGRITPGLPNRVRSTPSLSAAQVGEIPGEAVFSVTGGPQCADGMTWWRVNYNGLTGWTASGNNGEYWVEPY